MRITTYKKWGKTYYCQYYLRDDILFYAHFRKGDWSYGINHIQQEDKMIEFLEKNDIVHWFMDFKQASKIRVESDKLINRLKRAWYDLKTPKDAYGFGPTGLCGQYRAQGLIMTKDGAIIKDPKFTNEISTNKIQNGSITRERFPAMYDAITKP